MIKKIILNIFILFFVFTNYSVAEILKVGTIERQPMSFKTINGDWTGFSIDLLEKISQEAGFDYQLKEFDIFGNMISATEKSEVDFSIANITISSKREKKMDYSQPIIDSGLQILISKDYHRKNIFKIIWESGILWFLLGAVGLLLLIAHIVWFFERKTPSDRHDYFRDDYFGGIWDAFWWAFIIMTMGGFENEVPASKFSRFLAMVWIITSMFFISALTAQITSSLTVNSLNSDISSYQDLTDKKVGVMDSRPIIDFVENEIGVKPRVFKKYEDLYQALRTKKIDALIGDAPVVNYYASHEGQKYFEPVGEIFKPEKYGILFPENSPWKEKIDRAILKLQESGEYRNIYDKYF